MHPSLHTARCFDRNKLSPTRTPAVTPALVRRDSAFPDCHNPDTFLVRRSIAESSGVISPAELIHDFIGGVTVSLWDLLISCVAPCLLQVR
jgi:hypothetical protein